MGSPKILCIRLSAMGDLVVTTPVFRVLHQQLRARVHLITKANFQSVLLHNPYLEKIHLWGETSFDVLRQEKFDLVVDLHGNFRSHQLRLALGVPVVGFRKRNFEKSLLSRGLNLLGTEHLVDRYFYALRELGVKNDGNGLDYFNTPEEIEQAKHHTAPLGSAYAAIVLGATHYTKRMPAELVKNIVEKISLPLVLLGGEDVQPLAEAIIASHQGDKILNLCGKLPLRVSIATMADAEVVLAGDTGLMHLAAALGKRMVVVWGNTASEIGMYPYLPDEQSGRVRYAEVEGLACRPCSRIGFEACPLGHFKCMKLQSAEAIVTQLEQVRQEI